MKNARVQIGKENMNKENSRNNSNKFNDLQKPKPLKSRANDYFKNENNKSINNKLVKRNQSLSLDKKNIFKKKEQTNLKFENKYIKPKIVWKNINKFNVNIKLIELIKFGRGICKKIQAFLSFCYKKGNEILENLPLCEIEYEKLKSVFYKYKQIYDENKKSLDNLKRKNTLQEDENNELKRKIQEIRRQNEEKKEIIIKCDQKVKNFQKFIHQSSL